MARSRQTDHQKSRCLLITDGAIKNDQDAIEKWIFSDRRDIGIPIKTEGQIRRM
jgi:hypothetical protein